MLCSEHKNARIQERYPRSRPSRSPNGTWFFGVPSVWMQHYFFAGTQAPVLGHKVWIQPYRLKNDESARFGITPPLIRSPLPQGRKVRGKKTERDKKEHHLVHDLLSLPVSQRLPKRGRRKKGRHWSLFNSSKIYAVELRPRHLFKRKLYLQQKKSFRLRVQSSIMEVAKERQRLLATVRESIMMWKRSIKG